MPRITRARAATALVSIASVAVLLTGCAGAAAPASTVASDCTQHRERDGSQDNNSLLHGISLPEDRVAGDASSAGTCLAAISRRI
ncbi:hypothetical protein [Microbacterium sp. B24]|uniref:hypothetical protein n=1 Tax=Microbacterium sp. B24 TaxID=95616 RepID=UPI0004050929|nr:hypothetical protein [Microbacterium sp. B24]